MLAKLIAWKTSTQDAEERRDAPKSINFHEEYNSALRTKSYVDFFNKNSETLLLSYFDISAEASHICSHLLKSINQVHSNYQFIQRALAIKDGDYLETFELIIFELNSFNYSNNPFSNLKSHDFKIINDKHSSVLHHLKSMRKKVGRKIKLMKYLKKTSEVCVTAACGIVAITAMVIATRTLKKITWDQQFLVSHLSILRGSLEPINFQEKARLHDKIEHSRAMVQFCLDRKEDKFSLQVVKELKKSDVGFMKHVEELEEHQKAP
ncbi:hypothetical protein GLYMA_20G168000v4 [Glycine max]|uniref:Uncharacterized protein n=1 Tax=Glycine max TaxID=3847 RepID=A0A0R0ENQ2_SOYBN|nr:hypothetical protein GYH30_056110 [Glycine max]KRG91674.1 hypothetical protein GLYMA_20G168000v4 [Glycine max]